MAHEQVIGTVNSTIKWLASENDKQTNLVDDYVGARSTYIELEKDLIILNHIDSLQKQKGLVKKENVPVGLEAAVPKLRPIFLNTDDFI